MAKKKRKKSRSRGKKVRSRPQRDVYSISNLEKMLRPVKIERRKDILQDRRFFMPDKWSVLDDYGKEVRYKIASHTKTGRRLRDATQGRYMFRDPLRVPVCKRRKRRRESLFALKKIGKGKGGAFKKKRIMTELSKIRC